ncbi:hypothetical protein PAECIP111892_05238 [Paenibacillus auburnensis]|uniref:Uncharacterized protein n=1 Tax=Paenibacillus auburnensis TaxID=2905649 RepID=A0ABN8H214_9BACL|nr:hypothetical protein [Paenibacillus auburnensis]CAH1222927.1 hypothetical protein PAECIP111892_05238 [Paenibacillus auburnensis]
MFEGDYRYFGDHVEMTNALLFENGGTDGFFSTAYDVFFSAAIIGFLAEETSKEKGDRDQAKTIFSAKLSAEYQKTDIIARTLLLSDEKLDVGDEDYNRINRAMRHFSEDNMKKVNKNYIVGYALRGIEILHDRLIKAKSEGKDVVFIANELIDEYTSNNSSYQGIHELILELSK